MSTNGIELRRSENNNLTCVYIGDKLTLWFSYSTVVAFAISGEGSFKSENIWSRTTGRHLNTIAAKILPNGIFEERLKEFQRTLQVALWDADVTSYDGVVA